VKSRSSAARRFENDPGDLLSRPASRDTLSPKGRGLWC
jgi:hypothetical protein